MRTQQPKPGPQLTVSDVAPLIAFYVDVFDAVSTERECLLDGRVLQAEMIVGGYHLTAVEWYDDPAIDGGDGPAVLTVAPDDPQLLIDRALAAGAKLEPSLDGATGVMFRDPAGQRWAVTGAILPQ